MPGLDESGIKRGAGVQGAYMGLSQHFLWRFGFWIYLRGAGQVSNLKTADPQLFIEQMRDSRPMSWWQSRHGPSYAKSGNLMNTPHAHTWSGFQVAGHVRIKESKIFEAKGPSP